jgi:hypothetical protein
MWLNGSYWIVPYSLNAGTTFGNEDFWFQLYAFDANTDQYAYLGYDGGTLASDGSYSSAFALSTAYFSAGDHVAILASCIEAGDEFGDTSEFSEPAMIQDTPPRIVGVSVANAAGTFSETFAPDANGDDQLQTVRVPGGVTTVSITFNRDDVDADKSALAVVSRDEQTTIYAGDTDITWSGNGYTATWTLDSTVTLGEWYIVLDADDVLTPVGTLLDGDWMNPECFGDNTGNSEFPSGDGTADDDFQFAFTILPGDANRDGVVDLVDGGRVGANWHHTGATWEQGDFNGDEYVDLLDASILGAHWGMAYWQAAQGMAMLGGEDEDSLASLSASVDAIFAKYGLDDPDAARSWLLPGNETFDQLVKDLFDVLGVAI